MDEQVNHKRVKFEKGEQKKFILQSKKELGLTWDEFSKIANTCARNLIDWKNEKNTMSLFAVQEICRKRNCKIPSNIIIENQYWYIMRGAAKGGRANFEKYGKVGGDEKKRKEKWRKWWEESGRFKENRILTPLPFRKPKFSNDLAEFVGIMLGDGGITKNQLRVTLHCIDDAEYSEYVINLVGKLFGVIPGKHKKKDCQVFNIEISRVELVKFCTENLGLKVGSKVKQQVDVPKWIKNNKQYAIACLRGLIDTDGCLIVHKYRSKDKIYTYKKIGFTNRSYPLLRSVHEMLREVGIKNRIMKNNQDVRIEAVGEVEKYFKIVSSNNAKHLKRFAN